ncbi:MAG: hypothetical protein QW727_01725 [Candidatus Pacearchaeota archaeon]
MKKEDIQKSLDMILESFYLPPHVMKEITDAYRKVYGYDRFLRGLLNKYMENLKLLRNR